MDAAQVICDLLMADCPLDAFNFRCSCKLFSKCTLKPHRVRQPMAEDFRFLQAAGAQTNRRAADGVVAQASVLFQHAHTSSFSQQIRPDHF